jgi:DNA-binding NarL/FixJ family response regulator
VLVAERQAALRAGMRLALVRGGLSVCAEAADASAAVEAAVRELPHVCVVDVGLPGGGIAAAAGIRGRVPQAAVILVAEACSEQELFDAVYAGASGYLPKDTEPARLPEIVRAVLRGEAAIPRNLLPALLIELRERGRRRRVAIRGTQGVDLTPREWEVVELVREGLTTREIAGRLFLVPGTVRTHLAAAMRKLGVRDRGAAVRLLER